MSALYSPLAAVVHDLYRVDKSLRAQLDTRRSKVASEHERVDAWLARSTDVLAKIRAWSAAARSEPRTASLARTMLSRQQRVTARILTLRDQFDGASTPDEWNSVVERANGALEGTAKKGAAELAQLHEINAAIPKLEKILQRARSRIARLEGWADGPGAELKAKRLVNDLRAQTRQLRDRLAQSEASLAAADSTERWMTALLGVEEVSARCEEAAASAATLEQYDDSVRVWKREIATLRGEVDALRTWCENAKRWERSRSTAAAVEGHLHATRDALVRKYKQLAVARSGADIAAALEPPRAQLASVVNLLNAAKVQQRQLISELQLEASTLHDAVKHERALILETQRWAEYMTIRVVLASVVLAAFWWVFSWSFASKLLCTLLSLGAGGAVVTGIQQHRAKREADARSSERAKTEFDRHATPLLSSGLPPK